MSGKIAASKPGMQPKTKPDANAGRSGPNEGEGSQTGARQYDEATRAFVASGKVKPAAEKAARDLDGPGAESLKRAEEEGKKHSHGEDPLLRR
jgi:hypothetical protein